jgi:uncharacterized protein (TIGR00369 family)
MTAQTLPPGLTPIEEVKKLSGLEFLKGIQEGRLPPPPIAHHLGFTLTEVEEGRALFVGTPDFRLYNPIGSVHGGYIATLLDSAMSCAVHTTAPAGFGYTTVEIKVNFVRAVTDRTGPVRAEGKIINAGKRIGTSEGRLTDGQGRLLAHGTATCLIFPL